MYNHYVCPCPDGCNGCEVPDFAIKEIERLTADLNESERQTRAQLKRVLQRDERITKLEAQIRNIDTSNLMAQTKRITKLEAAITSVMTEEQLDCTPDCFGGLSIREELANSEGENHE